MSKPFDIKFDFALAHSDLMISLVAVAELHHSDPYYVVDNFHFAGSNGSKDDLSVLPSQEIKQITRDGRKVWVHKDSERESILSLAMGKAIENAPGNDLDTQG